MGKLNQNVTGADQGFLCVSPQSCPWSQGKPGNFTAALGTQSVDSMINKHPLSPLDSHSNSHFFPFLLFIPCIFSTQTLLSLHRMTFPSTLLSLLAIHSSFWYLFFLLFLLGHLVLLYPFNLQFSSTYFPSLFIFYLPPSRKAALAVLQTIGYSWHMKAPMR